MENYSETLKGLINLTLNESTSSDKFIIEPILRVFSEYNKTFLEGVKKLYQTTKKEKNRWNNLLLWLEAKRATVIDELKESRIEEIITSKKRVIIAVDALLTKVKTKIELCENNCYRLNNALLEEHAQQLSSFSETNSSRNSN